MSPSTVGKSASFLFWIIPCRVIIGQTSKAKQSQSLTLGILFCLGMDGFLMKYDSPRCELHCNTSTTVLLLDDANHKGWQSWQVHSGLCLFALQNQAPLAFLLQIPSVNDHHAQAHTCKVTLTFVRNLEKTALEQQQAVM